MELEQDYRSRSTGESNPGGLRDGLLFSLDLGTTWNGVPIVEVDLTDTRPGIDKMTRRTFLKQEELPEHLSPYWDILRVQVPTSLGEIKFLDAGLVNKILVAEDPLKNPRPLYDTLDDAERYRREAARSVAVLPHHRSYGDSDVLIANVVVNNKSVQNTLAGHLMAVDWIREGKWPPKTRNGVETKRLQAVRQERVTEILSYEPSAIARLCEIVRSREQQRRRVWRTQQDELESIMNFDITTTRDPKKVNLVTVVQKKMNDLKTMIMEYRPSDEELA